METISTTDKRIYPRREIKKPISICAGEHTYDSQLLNISQSGASACTKTSFTLNEKVSLKVNINNEELELNGKVVWSKFSSRYVDKPYDIGIRFENPDNQKLEALLKIKNINSVILFTLDSVYSTIAVNEIVRTFPDKISLICLSIPYSKKKGSFLLQAAKNLKNSGLIFTLYLGLYLYLHNFFIRILHICRHQDNKLLTIKELALHYNIPMLITDDINSEKNVRLFKNMNPDLVVSAHFDQKISKDILNIPQYGAINLHYSKLPEFRGPFPTFWALLQDRSTVGASIHFMNERFDEGDVIQQEDLKILPDSSIISLESKIFDIGAELIIRTIRKIEFGVLASVKQELLGQSSYYSYPSRKEIKTFLRKGRKIINFRHYLQALNGSLL